MNIIRAASGGLMGILCLLILQSCGGGGGYGGSSPSPTPITISVQPTTVVAGQSATVTWSVTAGSNCTASGAWSGKEPLSGTLTVTPTSAGTDMYTLTCSGGAYSSNSRTATLTVTAVSAFSVTNLVADNAAGNAMNVDANLVNPWGLSIPAGSAPAWIANNGTQTSTLYDGDGKSQPQPAASQLVVAFAAGAGGAAFNPSGVVSNSSGADFTVTAGATSGSALFIFDGEGGMIAGWSPSVDRTHAITMYSDAGGAVYKGLAIAKNAGALFLYATDFHNAKIDVFNTGFAKQATSATAFTFADPSIPAGYAPFGIQAIANGASGATQIYVTYAQQLAPDNHDNTSGAGLGYVDIYDTNGQLVKQLIATGALNAPWGMALAPADFGTFSNALLVGNFGDGKINAYDAAAGTPLGTISDAGNTPIATPGLWGIAFGNDANNQPHNTLFFAAGTNSEADGLYGRIDLGSTPPVLNAPPVVALTVPTGNLSGTVALSATVTDPIRIAKVDFKANGTLIASAAASPFSIQWDTTTVTDGQVSLTATATDADGNVGSSTASVVTVANNAPPPPPQVTLTQLQTQIFTPICSGCHSGVGSSLPGVQNLTAGNTFANVVNVASIEQPALKRIAPNDPTNSYLIQKIEGAPGITGSQMPFGCGGAGNPCLDQTTIDLVKTWVSQGALNN
ncbi:MAG TPA: TIGR03118 family protein [Steroidobacteraceae bacterium]|nr:TIGR03118 family protein [Steroidobacteraceae bacterium]